MGHTSPVAVNGIASTNCSRISAQVCYLGHTSSDVDKMFINPTSGVLKGLSNKMQSIAAPSLQIKTKVFCLRCYYLGKGSCVNCTPAAAIILISPPATWGHCSHSFIIIFIILCTFVPTREL